MAKPPVLRTKSATTKVTEAEYARLESLAEACGVNMSEWMRGRLLGRDGGSENDGAAVVLGEVLALRTILLNLLFSLTNGKPVTPEAMQELIGKAGGRQDPEGDEKAAGRACRGAGRGGLRWRNGDGKSTQKRGRAGGRCGPSGRCSRRWRCAPGYSRCGANGAGDAAEGLYWKSYLKSVTRGQMSASSAGRYTLLEGLTAKGQGVVLRGDQVETVAGPDGREGWRLTEAGAKLGIARLQWVTATFNDRGLHRQLGELVFADLEGWEFYQKPVYFSLVLLVLLRIGAVPKTVRGGWCGSMGGGCAGRSWWRRRHSTRSWASRKG